MLTRCGDDLFCLSAKTPQLAQAIAARLREDGGLAEVIPGIDSVVVRFDAALQDAATTQRMLEQVLDGEIPALEVSGECLEIPVVYGGKFGPDLDRVCKAAGLSEEELVEVHTGIEHTVDMIGFTPGFAFVSGLDERFLIPRREEPRQRVAAGSVAIADGRTGLYAMASPGGWNIIGRTPSRLFDSGAQDPFVLTAGMRLRFKAIAPGEFGA